MSRAAYLFDSRPPGPADHWRATAERRWFDSVAVELHLPVDSPPEVILLANKDDKGDLLTRRDHEQAEAACSMSR